MTAGAFLQGTAFVDLNLDHTLDPNDPYLSGATVSLYQGTIVDPAHLLNSVVTNAQGQFLFNDTDVPGGLNPGTYTLVETPPSGFVDTGVQILSEVDQATGINASTIQVTIPDPNQIYAVYDNAAFLRRNAWDNINLTFNGQAETGSAGQLPITLVNPSATPVAQFNNAGVTKNSAVVTMSSTSGFTVGAVVKITDGTTTLYSDVTKVTTNQSITIDNTWQGSTGTSATVTSLATVGTPYLSLCWDLANSLSTRTDVYQVLPTPGQGTPPNAAQIAYLYNHFGTVDIKTLSGTNPTTGLTQGTAAEAVGLQVAVWQLEYGSNFSLTGVTSTTDSESTSQELSDVKTWENYFLNVSAGKDETAFFLEVGNNVLQGGKQGILATGALEIGSTALFSPTLDTTPIPRTVTLGTSTVVLKDAGRLQGTNPTGTFTFELFLGSTLLDTVTVPVNGNGAYSTPTGFTLPTTGTVAGTYQWDAFYSGDSNNSPVSDLNNPTEQVVVSPASPAINTTPGGTVVIGSGAKLTDSATLSGGFNPTGSITFTLVAPNGTTVVDSETVPVTGDGTYSTPNGYLPTATGTYQWVASYSGDVNNSTVTSVSGNEPELVTPGTPSVNTIIVTANGSALAQPAPLGTSVEDTASFTNLASGVTPTGTVTYTFTGSELQFLTAPSSWTVSGSGAGTTWSDTVTVSGGLIPASAASGALVAGSYNFMAVYSGDSNYTGATSPAEPLIISQGTSSTTTTFVFSNPFFQVVGTTAFDTAVVTTSPQPFKATGTVTYTFTGAQLANLTAPPSWTVVNSTTWSETVTLNNGQVPPSASTPALPAGSYQFQASYSGDNNYLPSPASAVEPFVITQGGSATFTTILDAVSNNEPNPPFAGESVYDTATVMTFPQAFTPTGTVTYFFMGAQLANLTAPPGWTVVNSTTWSETVTLVNGLVPNTAPTPALPAGDYQFEAGYNGDNNYQASPASESVEPLTIPMASPTIVTTPNPTTVTLGTSTVVLNDSATLSGGFNPTGTITFTLFLGTTQVDTEMVQVNGDGTYSTPTGYTLPTTGTVTGTYQWDATYSGDTNNLTASDTSDPAEQAVVSPASPTIVTTPNPTSVSLGTPPPNSGGITFAAGPANSNTVTQGTSTLVLNDAATLSGGYNPTGTITFTLFLGSTLVDTETVQVNGNGTYNTPTGFTLPTTGTVAGTYQWDATYSGDGNNSSVSESNDPAEQVVVSPASPSIVTTPNPTSVTGGTTTVILNDTATLSGGSNPTGTITFTLFLGSTLVDTETVQVNGNGTYSTPTGFTLPTTSTVTGTYQWDATYNGDSNNSSASDTSDEAEQVVVSPASPSIVTTPNPTSVTGGTTTVILNDTATLSGGSNPTGTITFTLFLGSTQVDTETVQVNGNGTYSTPTGFTLPTTITVAATYQWDATYSGDGNNNSISDINNTNEIVSVIPPAIVPIPPVPPPPFASKVQLFASNVLALNGTQSAQAAFVNGLYTTVLNRAADPAGLTNWVLAMQEGLPRTQVVQDIWQSAEHRGLQVDQFYTTLLHRTADPAGRAIWVNAFLHGATEQQVMADFLLTPEYQAAHASNQAFVSGLFTDVLGRPADASGLSGWLQFLQNGGSRAAVANGFVDSAELEGDDLAGFYTSFLGRQASAAEVQAWLTLLQNGQGSLDSVAEQFLASTEFFARFANM